MSLLRNLLPALVLAGCSGELSLEGPSAVGEPGGGGGDVAAAREMWDSSIAPLVQLARPKGACVTCHQGGLAAAPAFLGTAGSDGFEALIGSAYIGATPEM